jgi:hypothetical protein
MPEETLNIPNFGKVEQTKAASGKTIQERFTRFHELNPVVYRNLVALARQLVGRGHQKLGIGMLFEILRWKYLMETTDPNSEYRLSNDYRSRYARLIMEREKDLCGCFNTRNLTTE